MEIIPILCLKDNYAYLVHDSNSKQTLVIDPSESGPVLKTLKEKNWSLNTILNTHHHWDHVGGNLDLKKLTGCKIMGSEKDKNRLPGLDVALVPGKSILFANQEVDTIDIPGHTHGHMAYYFKSEKALFPGDTLFSLGCGRLFEGTAVEMFESLNRLKQLPVDTLVYPGHEYTESNLQFALTLNTCSSELLKKKEAVEKLRAQGKPTIPSRLAEELNLNPFLLSKNADDFATLRKQKDNF